MQQLLSDSNSAQLEALAFGQVADPTLRSFEKRTRKFSRDDAAGKDFIVSSELLLKRYRKEQLLPLRGTATNKAKTSKPGSE